MSTQLADGRLRIIGGSWRGRKLNFPELAGLRPTSDRTRETLFNWLQPKLGGAQCLDLFAGSGALGFEAASRGAEKVVMVESNRQAAAQLTANLELLSATQCEMINTTAENFLAKPATPFDIVFIDPPFDANLWMETITLLNAQRWLAPAAQIYLEAPKRLDLADLPESWTLTREKMAGAVRYCLFTYNGNSS
jgi:16S rRNA (guanine966-N2)-methyltransferase